MLFIKYQMNDLRPLQSIKSISLHFYEIEERRKIKSSFTIFNFSGIKLNQEENDLFRYICFEKREKKNFNNRETIIIIQKTSISLALTN